MARIFVLQSARSTPSQPSFSLSLQTSPSTPEPPRVFSGLSTPSATNQSCLHLSSPDFSPPSPSANWPSLPFFRLLFLPSPPSRPCSLFTSRGRPTAKHTPLDSRHSSPTGSPPIPAAFDDNDRFPSSGE
ncbi:hypothetical protein AWENTII_001272 [Aspergillus wentii]